MTDQTIRLALYRVMPIAFMLAGIFAIGKLGAQEDRSSSDKAIARTHIIGLKEGALLVRLQTRSQSIETFKERGMIDRAEQLERHQREVNAEYVEAFVSEFDFAPVYFFRSEDSGMIKEGRLHEVVFLNHDLVSDSTIRVEQRIVYTAEFSAVAPSDEKIRQDYRLEKDSTGLNQKPTYYGSTNMGFEALVIMTDQFVQLRRPFPYYTRTFGQKGLLSRKPRITVRKMNQKLHQFY